MVAAATEPDGPMARTVHGREGSRPKQEVGHRH